MTLLPPTAAPFVIHTRTYYQTNSERNKLPPTFSQKIPKMHLCHGIVLSVASQTINHLRSGARACTNFYAHIHTPHTLLEPDSLIHCCHGNPIKGGHSGCNSGEISLLYLSISLSFTHTHTHTPSFSFTASHFYLSPSITFSSSPIVLLRLSLHHPCCTSLPVSLHYCATFSSSHLPPRTSQANVNMSSHFSNPHRVYISDFCLVSTHTF